MISGLVPSGRELAAEIRTAAAARIVCDVTELTRSPALLDAVAGIRAVLTALSGDPAVHGILLARDATVTVWPFADLALVTASAEVLVAAAGRAPGAVRRRPGDPARCCSAVSWKRRAAQLTGVSPAPAGPFSGPGGA